MPESTVYSRYEAEFAVWAIAQGWRVTKRGWPDFICRRGDELMAVEVKGGNDGLSAHQSDAIRDLRRAGFPTFLWTPEQGLSEVRGTPLSESIASLLAENENLRRLVADVVDIKARIAAVPQEPVRRVRFGDEEGLCLKELTEWCTARHGNHRERLYGGNLGLCAWIVYLSGRQPVEKVAEMVGLDLESTERFLVAAIAKRDSWLHNLRHKVMEEGEVCADCARAA